MTMLMLAALAVVVGLVKLATARDVIRGAEWLLPPRRQQGEERDG